MPTFDDLRDCDDEAAESIIVEYVQANLADEAQLELLVQALKQLYDRGLEKNPLESVALSVIPLLLDPTVLVLPSVKSLLSLVGRHSNSKEMILALGEGLNSFISSVSYEEEDSEPTTSLDIDTILVYLDLYKLSIPRLNLRKKSPVETVLPILALLSDALSILPMTRDGARSLISSICDFMISCYQWVSQPRNSPAVDGVVLGKKVLSDFLLESLVTCSSHVDFGVASLAFKRVYSRFALPSRAPSSTRMHDSMDVALIWSTFITLGGASEAELKSSQGTRNVLGSLVILVLVRNSISTIASPPLPVLDDTVISNVVAPALLSSSCLDHILAYLIESLPPQLLASGVPRSDSAISVLIGALVPLASMHPNAEMRHISFRLISTLIAQIRDDAIRLSELIELIKDTPFPQMQIAAIGILRTSILEALPRRKTSTVENVSERTQTKLRLMASPALLETISPILFKIDPLGLPDNIEEGAPSLEAFSESPEPGRLAEALNLYYAVLVADKENLTGIRSYQHLQVTEKQFLEPIRAFRIAWRGSRDEDVVRLFSTRLLSLVMGIEGVDGELFRLRESK